jgi:hypothetical protein
MRLAGEHRLTLYDATYLELSVRLSLPLATFDSTCSAPGVERRSCWRDAVDSFAGVKNIVQRRTSGFTNDQHDPLLKGHVDKDSPYLDIVFTDHGQASAFARGIRSYYKTGIAGLRLNYPAGPSLVPFKMTDVPYGSTKEAPTAKVTYRAPKPIKE